MGQRRVILNENQDADSITETAALKVNGGCVCGGGGDSGTL